MIAQAQAKDKQMRPYVDGRAAGPQCGRGSRESCGCTPIFPCAPGSGVGPDTELPAEILDHRERALDNAPGLGISEILGGQLAGVGGASAVMRSVLAQSPRVTRCRIRRGGTTIGRARCDPVGRGLATRASPQPRL